MQLTRKEQCHFSTASMRSIGDRGDWAGSAGQRPWTEPRAVG